MRPALALPIPDEHHEAHAVLTADADGHTGSIPATLIATHILKVTQGGDFPLERSALEALLRRFKAMRESAETWRLESKPRGRAHEGLYRMAVGRGRSYQVLLSSAELLDASCECADFLHGSLALCKHTLWLLDRCFSASGADISSQRCVPLLSWNPVRSLTGPGDWLEGLIWSSGSVPASLRPWFSSPTGPCALRPPQFLETHSRDQLLRALRTWAKSRASAELPMAPSLTRMLHDETARRALQTEGAISARELDRALKSLKRTLFPYQLEGVRRFLEAGRLLLGDDMGLGKTAQAVASCHVLYTSDRVRRGLVIVPAALKSQWLREWKLFSDVPVELVDGPPEARARQYRKTRAGFLVLNYEQVLKDLPELLRFAPEMVVLDEAQRIKNWATKTSLTVKRLQPRWRLVLSGTPMENRLTELASLMEWVDERALEPKWRLAEWHTVRGDGQRQVLGARNLDTLRERLSASLLRRVRKEVLTQLPPRSDTSVPVDLTPEQLAAHEELDAPIARLTSIARRRPLTQPEFLRLMTLMLQQRVICNGLAQRDFEQVWPELEQASRPTEARLRELSCPKLLELRELVSNLVATQGRKVVVFSAWRRMLRLAQWAVSDLLADAGARSVFFTGEESQKRRTQNVVDFHDDEKTRVFFATDAGGVGLNLQRAASACIHLDLPWNPAVLEQRSGRIYRLGQKDPVEIYSLVASTGIESRIASVVGAKKALFDGLFDGSSDEVRFEKGGSFLDTLRELAPAPIEEVDSAGPAEDEDAPEATAEVSDATPPLPDVPPPPAAFGPWTGISVQRLEDGRMVLEAQPEAAASFAAMLEGVAGLLRQAAAPPAPRS